MASDLSSERLESLVESALEAVGHTLGKPPEQLLEAVSKSLSHGNSPTKNNKKVSFTLIAVYIFAATMYQLSRHAHVRCAFKGKTTSGGTVRTYASVFFGKYGYVASEYLVDFYACANDKLLCPLLTMESEATAEDKTYSFYDFKKLLSVSSPRRIYLFQCSEARLGKSIESLSKLLDEAYQSQIVLRGDEVVVVAHVKRKKSYSFETYTFDQGARMGHVSSQVAPAVT